MAENLVKKITVKGVCGEIMQPIKGDVLLMRVYGKATGFEVYSGSYDKDSLRFKGIFKAVNAETGEVFRAGQMFLPGVAESLLGGALEGENAAAVDFAFDIGVKPAKNPVGYEFTVKPVLDIKEDESVLALETAMGKLPALAAPKKAAK